MIDMFKRLLLAASLLIGTAVYGQQSDAEVSYESLEVAINFEKYTQVTLPSLYIEPGQVFLPVSEFFDFLKVPNTTSSDGTLVKGFFENEANKFVIDYNKRAIIFNNQSFTLLPEDFIMDLGLLFVRTSALDRAFGFHMKFDFRGLSIMFTSDFELPLFKLMRLEKAREKLRAMGSEEAVYDTILPRDYHWFRAGMMDWSVSSNQSSISEEEHRFGLGLGAEVLGGETNVQLSYSTLSGLPRNQQQYSWRWADNNAKVVRQIQLGRIQSKGISSILSPVDGFTITNAMTSLRKSLGTYRIAEYTRPDWVVELYLNNVLITYTRADASGYFTFDVPIVYGTTNVVLRFYGPEGEIQSMRKTLNMPYNMLPKGEFEYSVNGGMLLDSVGTLFPMKTDSTGPLFGRVAFDYGVNRWLTLGGGLEYLTSISDRPEVPFLTFTFQPYSKLLITGEYAHHVRAKAIVNMTLPYNMVLDGTFAKYVPGQEAIIYNYLQERSVALSVPYRYRLFSGSLRGAWRQNVYEAFSYNSWESLLMGNYRSWSMNYNHYLNTSSASTSNMYGTLVLGKKLSGGANIRASGQYNYSFHSLMSLKGEIERKITNAGHLSLRLEHNFQSQSYTGSITFRYELPYMTASFSSGASHQNSDNVTSYQASESASGSFAFNSGNHYVHVDKRASVGRSGIAIMPFIDINFNNVWDENEPASKGMKVRCSGGQVLQREQDSIIRIVGLEPFVDYTLLLDESGFDNVAWHINSKSIKLTTDPNQFKKIELPVYPMAEIYGQVADENGKGIGRIIIRFKDTNGKLVAKVLTESDGYFNYIGFKPGDYQVSVDSLQLEILKKRSTPVWVTALENVDGDVVDAGTIELVDRRVIRTRKVRKAVAGGKFEEVEESYEVKEADVVNEMATVAAVDSLPFFTVLFDPNASVVKKEYRSLIKRLADYLNTIPNDTMCVEIQGYTDADADDLYNLRLSEDRAKSVKAQLMRMGVNPRRLTAKGYGKRMLINANSTAEEKALNRRVVFQHASSPGLPVNEWSKSAVTEKSRKAVQVFDGVPSYCHIFVLKGHYSIQIGAFLKRMNAEGAVAQIMPYMPEKLIILNEGRFFKVQVGYYDSLQDALSAARLLYDKGVLK
jgi:outer membrane protein OmpA-like peptidoglycan-associated protein